MVRYIAAALLGLSSVLASRGPIKPPKSASGLKCDTEEECKAMHKTWLENFSTPDPDAAIVNGCEVSTDEAPFYARLFLCQSQWSGCAICGGAFVSPTRVLTAAHCVIGANFIKVFATPANNQFPSDWSNEDYVATDYVIHKDYVHGNIGIGYDIAMIKLPANSEPYTQYIEMAGMSDFNARQHDDPMIAYGTGTTATGEDVSDTLLESYPLGFMPCSEMSSWKRWNDGQREVTYNLGVTEPKEKFVCVNATESASTGFYGSICQGDSGGPLVYGGKLYGVTSYNYPPCQNFFPQVFNNVGFFMDSDSFIPDNMEDGIPTSGFVTVPESNGENCNNVYGNENGKVEETTAGDNTDQSTQTSAPIVDDSTINNWVECGSTGMTYNPDHQVCCQDNYGHWITDIQMGCPVPCGNYGDQYYPLFQETCCDGDNGENFIVYEGMTCENATVCGNIVYDPTWEYCCEGWDGSPFLSESGESCDQLPTHCGWDLSMTFNMTTERCCFTPENYGQYYILPITEDCLPYPDDMALCEMLSGDCPDCGIWYNTTEEECCQAYGDAWTILLEDEFRSCPSETCGVDMMFYDSQTHVCCHTPNGDIVNPMDVGCDDVQCGLLDLLYNPLTHICCEDGLDMDLAYIESIENGCDDSIPECGDLSQSYDPQYEVCCEDEHGPYINEIEYGCTGVRYQCGTPDITYNPATEVCCELFDGITFVDMIHRGCPHYCGSYHYYPSFNETCCDDVQGEEYVAYQGETCDGTGNSNHCGWDVTNTFNRTIDKCCFTPENNGYYYIHPIDEECLPYPDVYALCEMPNCGMPDCGIWYNTLEQECCQAYGDAWTNDLGSEVGCPTETESCGVDMMFYDPQTHVCCNTPNGDIVYPMDVGCPNDKLVCGTGEWPMEYDPQFDHCCEILGDYYLNPLGMPCDESEWCGNVEFDPYMHDCCNSTGVSGNVEYWIANNTMSGGMGCSNSGYLECGPSEWMMTYDPSMDQCCEILGDYYLNPLGMPCDETEWCGNIEFDPWMHECCNSTGGYWIANSTMYGGTGCDGMVEHLCGPTELNWTYNPLNETCCSTQNDYWVISNNETCPETQLSPCGDANSDLLYDQSFELCCQNENGTYVVPITDMGCDHFGESDMCGPPEWGWMYDSALEHCCSMMGDYFTVPVGETCPNEGSYCGNHWYDEAWELCCEDAEGHFVSDSSIGCDNVSFCGPRDYHYTYHALNETCCTDNGQYWVQMIGEDCPNDGGSPCGNTGLTYYPQSELCCDSPNGQWVANMTVGCGDNLIPCGFTDVMYDPMYDVCCDEENGILEPIEIGCGGPGGDNMTYCGNFMFHQHYEVCCEDDMGHFLSTIEIGCDNVMFCGPRDMMWTYNPLHETCCSDSDYPFVVGLGEDCVDPHGYTCGADGYSYDPQFEMCCDSPNGHWVANMTVGCGDNLIPCGFTDVMYDPMTHVCCDENYGILEPIEIGCESPGGEIPCGTEDSINGIITYDPSMFKCCEILGEYYIDSLDMPCDEPQWCGNELQYDAWHHTCCHGGDDASTFYLVEFDMPCEDGEQHFCGPQELMYSYNPANETCCGTGNDFWVISSDMACPDHQLVACDGASTVMHDPLLEICCDTDTEFPFVTMIGTDCHSTGSEYCGPEEWNWMYNPLNETCCTVGGESFVSSIEEGCGALLECGEGIYDPSLEMCCSDLTVWLISDGCPQEDNHYCGPETDLLTYDPAISDCCQEGGQHWTMPIGSCPPVMDEECGTSFYNIFTEECCADGTVAVIGNCGGVVIDTQECGPQLTYNTAEQQCCEDVSGNHYLVLVAEECADNTLSLCGENNVYDTLIEECCADGTVAHIGNCGGTVIDHKQCGPQITYNAMEQQCCEDGVGHYLMPIGDECVDNTLALCGEDNVYDTLVEECCEDGSVTSIGNCVDNTLAVCGDEPLIYDVITEQCCDNGDVFNPYYIKQIGELCDYVAPIDTCDSDFTANFDSYFIHEDYTIRPFGALASSNCVKENNGNVLIATCNANTDDPTVSDPFWWEYDSATQQVKHWKTVGTDAEMCWTAQNTKTKRQSVTTALCDSTDKLQRFKQIKGRLHMAASSKLCVAFDYEGLLNANSKKLTIAQCQGQVFGVDTVSATSCSGNWDNHDSAAELVKLIQGNKQIHPLKDEHSSGTCLYKKGTKASFGKCKTKSAYKFTMSNSGQIKQGKNCLTASSTSKAGTPSIKKCSNKLKKKQQWKWSDGRIVLKKNYKLALQYAYDKAKKGKTVTAKVAVAYGNVFGDVFTHNESI